MVAVTLLAKDNDKPGNREVIQFLKQYLPALVKAGLVFTFKIVEPKDEAALVKNGMDRLPLALIGSQKYASSVEIKSILMKYLAASSAVNPDGPRSRMTPRPARTPEDEMRQFYESEMNEEALEREKDALEMGANKKDLMEKYQEEVERRQQEDAQRGPKNKKPGSGRRPPRADNVDQEDTPRRPTTRIPAIPGRPTGRLGADPANKDDALLENMLETSD